MLRLNKDVVVRSILGSGVLVALALLAGLESAIQAKAPSDIGDDLRIPAMPARGSEVAVIARPAAQPKIADKQVALLAPPSAPRQDLLVASPASPAKAERFDLSTAERLAIRFQGYTELSGEYRIGADGAITVPVIGRIPVSGMTAAELETLLSDRATKATGRDAYITVEVAEYKPVFVSGYVSKPGAIAWKPGMMVTHAVTQMGGVYRATIENGGGAVIGADAELVRLRRASMDLKRNLAAISRLQAERDDKPTIAIPERLLALVGKKEAEALVGDQTTVLVSRRSGVAAQIASLERAHGLAEQEYTGLKAQSQRIKELLAARKDYKTKIEGLQAKGIVRMDRSMDETAKVGELEDRLTTTSVGIARVQGLMSQLDRSLINLRQERIATIDTEILKLEREVAQLDLEREAATVAYRKITGTPPPSTFADKPEAKTASIEYELVRFVAGKEVRIKAGDLTPMRPGDILNVATRAE